MACLCTKLTVVVNKSQPFIKARIWITAIADSTCICRRQRTDLGVALRWPAPRRMVMTKRTITWPRSWPLITRAARRLRPWTLLSITKTTRVLDHLGQPRRLLQTAGVRIINRLSQAWLPVGLNGRRVGENQSCWSLGRYFACYNFILTSNFLTLSYGLQTIPASALLAAACYVCELLFIYCTLVSLFFLKLAT